MCQFDSNELDMCYEIKLIRDQTKICTKITCDVFNSKVLGTVSIGCTEGVEKKSIRRQIPRRQSNFLAFSASFTQCSAHATFHLQVYGVHDLWCKLLLCTTVLVQDAGAGVKNDSMVYKKLGDIFEMVEKKKKLVYTANVNR